MKKFLFTLGCLMAVTLVQAQTLVAQLKGEFLVPIFNSCNKAIFVLDYEEPEQNDEIVFYDSKFDIIKSIAAYTGEEYTSRKTEVWERKLSGAAYQGDWEMTSTESEKSKVEIEEWISYRNVNKNIYGESEKFTVDVFDNDVNTIEYLVPVYELQDSPYYIYEDDRDGDGEIDYKRVVYYSYATSYDLYSDGVKKGRINCPIEYIYIIDGDTYFVSSDDRKENDEYIYTTCIYHYDKQTNAIEQVQEFKSTTIRKNNDIVEIGLGHECDNKCEIVVTSANGKQYARKQVAAGTRVVNIDTRGFANGIYNFSIMDNGKVIENGKIIIR